MGNEATANVLTPEILEALLKSDDPDWVVELHHESASSNLPHN